MHGILQVSVLCTFECGEGSTHNAQKTLQEISRVLQYDEVLRGAVYYAEQTIVLECSVIISNINNRCLVHSLYQYSKFPSCLSRSAIRFQF